LKFRGLIWFTLLLAAAIVCQAQPLTITTTQLPAAQVNLPYNATLNATGGTPPYTWSIVAGAWCPSTRPVAEPVGYD